MLGGEALPVEDRVAVATEVSAELGDELEAVPRRRGRFGTCPSSRWQAIRSGRRSRHCQIKDIDSASCALSWEARGHGASAESMTKARTSMLNDYQYNAKMNTHIIFVLAELVLT